jgi:hypothetical protein
VPAGFFSQLGRGAWSVERGAWLGSERTAVEGRLSAAVTGADSISTSASSSLSPGVSLAITTQRNVYRPHPGSPPITRPSAFVSGFN